MSAISLAPTEDDIVLGRRLRNIRLRMGMSQKDLADKIGIAFQQIQKYETASNRIAVSRLIQIARALGVTVSQLLGEKPGKSHNHDAEMGDMISRMYMLPESHRKLIHELVGMLTNYARPTAPKKPRETKN